MAMDNPKENDSLVNALESIKGLLEQSETKLNAARESIELATPKNSSIHDSILPTNYEEEFDVPVLDDIVAPISTPIPKQADLLESSDLGNSDIDVDVLLAFVDEMQKNIEKNMRDTLMQAVVRAEQDIKKQISAYLDQLRDMMDR